MGLALRTYFSDEQYEGMDGNGISQMKSAHHLEHLDI